MVQDGEEDFTGIMGAKAETDFHEPDKGITACMVACFEACKAVCSDVDLDDRTEDIAGAAFGRTQVRELVRKSRIIATFSIEFLQDVCVFLCYTENTQITSIESRDEAVTEIQLSRDLFYSWSTVSEVQRCLVPAATSGIRSVSL